MTIRNQIIHSQFSIICKRVLFFTLFISSASNAQDIISTKSGTVLNVKIIHVDADYIFFHQTLDTTKTIRKVSRKSITNYAYNSIEQGRNNKVMREDSILYTTYMRNVEGIYYTENNEMINLNLQKKIAKRDSLAIVKLNRTPTTQKRFTNAGDCLIAASVFLVAGSVIHIYAEDRELKNNPSTLDIKNFNEEQQFLKSSGYLFYGFSGLFVLGAGINLHSGAMQLKP